MGIQVLTQAPGPVDMTPFISRYVTGSGDYTRDRHQWLPDDPEEIVARVLERQKTTGNPADSEL